MLSRTDDNTDIILNSIALMFVFTADTDMVQESDKILGKILLTYASLVLEDKEKKVYEITDENENKEDVTDDDKEKDDKKLD